MHDRVMTESDSRVRNDNQGLYIGARKLWGTSSNVSVELVREKTRKIACMGSDESIEVVKVFREGARLCMMVILAVGQGRRVVEFG